MTAFIVFLIAVSIVYIGTGFVILIAGIITTSTYLENIYYYPDDSDYLCFLVRVEKKEGCKIVINNNGYKFSIKRMLIHSFIWVAPIFKSIYNFFSLLEW